MTAIRATDGSRRTRACATPAARCSTCFVGLGQGLIYLLVVGGGLVLGDPARPAVDRPAAAGRHGAAGVAARRGRAAPGQPAAGDAPAAGPAPPARAARRCARSSAARAFWRVAAMLLLKLPVSLAGLLVAGLAPVAAGGRPRSGSRAERARGRRRAARRAVGARRRRSGSRCACSRCRRRSSRSRRWTARPPCCARSPGAAALARARGRAGARAAGREPRRPLAERSPTGCPTARSSSTSAAARSSCPEPGSGARLDRGRPRRACGSRRSSTTPSSTPRPSWSRRPPRPPRWRSTTSA